LAWAEQDNPVDQQPHRELADRLARVDPGRLLPAATLYVHVSRETLETGHGVARLEGVGPITAGQAAGFLRHSNVTISPVLDLAGGSPVDCYEVPARMHQVVKLRHPFEIFPWGTIGSRRSEDDHTRRYVPPDQGGPPGQTHPDNLAPLGRRHHRVKTHARGWRHHQIAPGSYLWRTATGHWYRVDRDGSHHLGKHVSPLEQRLTALVRDHLGADQDVVDGGARLTSPQSALLGGW
jgi:hypothetical protein